MQHQTPPPIKPHRAKEALVRGAIWGFIGLLYAILFVFFAILAEYWLLPIDPLFLAGILAGTFGALIYSSMRLAVLMTIIISPVCIFYFILADRPVNPLNLLLIVAIAGALIGAMYGNFSVASRVNRADAKTLAGFSSGWLASLGYLLLSNLIDAASMSMIIAFMCPLTGILYVSMVPGFIRIYDNLLPPVGDGLIVGIGVSGFVALSFFVMISSVDNSVAGPLLPALDRVRETLPGAVAGGMLGGGLAGIISGLLLTDWQDL
ncbi:MAG: hypothetical protein KZQ95_04240 [Candidatus Thiodiazotropha sp. (ex Epidulcina cf. delphinae)]|nr:hypothetical protein [Candidatus Thiodiazotropha sp. (ex Epidulcina cf. delphinae)]